MAEEILTYIWCPYCHCGQSCVQKGNLIYCPKGPSFTIEQSVNDIKATH